MWFTPLKGEENSDVLVKRVVHMTDVVSVYIRMIKTYLFSRNFQCDKPSCTSITQVAACGENGDWYEQLLENVSSLLVLNSGKDN